MSRNSIYGSHQLKEIHLTKRINICDSLLRRNEIDSFLKRLITSDQKWIVYTVQTTLKDEIHQKKIMLSAW